MNMCRKVIDFSDLQADFSYLDDIVQELTESEYQIIEEDTQPVKANPFNAVALISNNVKSSEVSDISIDKKSFVDVSVEQPLNIDELSVGDTEQDIYDFWTDDDDLDISDDQPSALLSKSLTKYDKALQVAIEFVSAQGLDESSVSFFEEVFVTFGYGRTRRALSKRLYAGHTVEELEAAFWVKTIWSSSSHFGLSFKRAADNFSDTEHEYCSWVQALTLITRLPENVSYEEVLDVMELEFNTWFSSPSARKAYPQFSAYLFNHPHPLTNIFCGGNGFESPVENENFDADWLNQSLHPDNQTLLDYGLLSDRYQELNFEVEEC